MNNPNIQTQNNLMKNQTVLADQELLLRYRNGDSSAMNILIQRHKQKIFSSINLLIKDKYLAEDIFQELFIKIIDTVRNGQYREENKFVYWAMRIAHNMCVDHFRKVKMMPMIRTSEGEDIFENFNFLEQNVEEKITKQETHQLVSSLLNLLPDEQKEVIILRHYAGLKFKDISKLIGCSVNTSLGRMRYGLINLRKMIDEKKLAVN